MQGRKLADRGWNLMAYADGFGSHEHNLSRWLWTHKNLPAMEFVVFFFFQLDLKAALITLELHAVKFPRLQNESCRAPNTLSFLCCDSNCCSTNLR